MDWNAIGAIGEVGGAIGVVVTLIYLARQIREAPNDLLITGSCAKAAVGQRLLKVLVREGVRELQSILERRYVLRVVELGECFEPHLKHNSNQWGIGKRDFRRRSGGERIVGHTDSVGTSEYNQSLSTRRASSAARYLATQGIGAGPGELVAAQFAVAEDMVLQHFSGEGAAAMYGYPQLLNTADFLLQDIAGQSVGRYAPAQNAAGLRLCLEHLATKSQTS